MIFVRGNLLEIDHLEDGEGDGRKILIDLRIIGCEGVNLFLARILPSVVLSLPSVCWLISDSYTVSIQFKMFYADIKPKSIIQLFDKQLVTSPNKMSFPPSPNVRKI
jgi:hypothetical protein